MTIEQIQTRGDYEAEKYDTAKKIRALLDVVRQVAEQNGGDADEFEGAILELVMEDS